MAVELQINGYLHLTFMNVHTGEDVEEDIEQGILDNLQQGEYLISLANKTVLDINDLQNPIYKFDIDTTDALEYEFDEI